jgi:hypothetical protein
MLSGSDTPEAVSANVNGPAVAVSVAGVTVEAGVSTLVYVTEPIGETATYIVNSVGAPIQLRGDATLPAISVPRFD